MPVVTATTACCGSRPLANALGDGLSMMATRGVGNSAYVASSATESVELGRLGRADFAGARHAQGHVA